MKGDVIMALTKCPECGTEGVSDSAVACPHCGFNIQKYYQQQKEHAEFINRLNKEEKKRRGQPVAAQQTSGFTPTLGHLLLFLVLLVITIGAFGFALKDDNGEKSQDRLYNECYLFSQYLVKEQLKSPSSAKFPSYSQITASQDGDTVTIYAYVNADNSFGANIKTNYTAIITIVGNKPNKGSVMLLE